MTTLKNEIITAFKNSCVLLDIKTVMKRSSSVKYQFQRNIWEIQNEWFGFIRIEDRINNCYITLFPIMENGFHSKKEITCEITRHEYEELRKLYFGNFKEDKNYWKRINKLFANKK